VETASFYSVSLTDWDSILSLSIAHRPLFFSFSSSCKFYHISLSQFWDKDKKQRLWTFDTYHGRDWSGLFWLITWWEQLFHFPRFRKKKKQWKAAIMDFCSPYPLLLKTRLIQRYNFKRYLNWTRLTLILTSTDRYNNVINNREMIQLRLN
jgi:hypothetical protein